MRRKHPFDHLGQRWAGCLEAFFSLPGLHKHTLEDYRTYLSQAFAQQAPDELTSEDITAYVESPSRKGPANEGTRRHRRITLSTFYSFAQTYIPAGENAPIISHNPAQRAASERRYSSMPADPFAHLSQNWRDCIRDFLASIEAISGSKKSYVGYRSILARFFQSDTTKSPEQFSRRDVMEWIRTPATGNRNHREVLSASSQNGRLSALVSLFRFASGWEISKDVPLFQQKSPTDGIRFLRGARPNKALSEQAIRAFFAAIDRSDVKGKRDYAFMLTAFFTARRVQELARLTFGDIEQVTMNGRQIHVFKFSQKGHSADTFTQELPGECVRAIAAYVQAAGRQNASPDEPLFAPLVQGHPTQHRAKPLNTCYLNLLMRGYLVKAGINPDGYSMHSLRHSSASQRFAAGENLRSLQRLLGHSSLESTSRYIAHLTGHIDSQVLSEKFGDL